VEVRSNGYRAVRSPFYFGADWKRNLIKNRKSPLF
jgi:hypothetical protein